MSQFRSTGGIDDAIAEDGDRGFAGINQRLQLNQLQAGEVRESLNGRMEGYWRPRKGIINKTGNFTSGTYPLQLPFYLIDSPKSITNAFVPSIGTIHITVLSHGFEEGSTGWARIAGLDAAVNGDYELSYIDADTLQYNVDGVTSITDFTGTLSQMPINDDAIGSVRASCLFSDPNTNNKEYVIVALDTVAKKIDLGKNNLKEVVSATQSGTTVTMRVTNHNVNVGSTISVTGLTGGDPANGSFVVTRVIDANRFRYTFDTSQTITFGVASALMSDGYLESTDIPYPTGQALGADADMIQVFDKVMLFRDGQQAFEWYPNGRPIISASSNATASPNTVVTMNVREHGLVVGASVTIAGLTGGTTQPNGTYVVASVSSQDVFTFVASGISTSTTFTTTAATMTDGFTFSPGGSYTQPQTFNATGTNVTVVNGLVSVTVTANTTLQAGDVIVLYEATIPEFTAFVGQQFYLTSATTTQLQFFAPIGNISSGSGSQQIEIGGRFSVGSGFMHQPGAPWGTYFQRRLWVPYYYDQSGAYNAVTYTDRKIADEIAVSDILDTTTFDQIENQFRISGGTADYVVGMHGFYEDGLIVFNRNSLHLISGTQGSLLDTKVTELTSEIGCLARKTIVSRGNMVMFLSDDGVYAVEFLNDYNLRGADEPISKNIQPYIDRINKNYADRAVGVLFDNRYYLAVPLDSAPGIGDARGNNSILVFNFLNKGWESLDTFGDNRFTIENFVLGSAGVRNNIYAVTANGGLHQLEAADTSNDSLSVSNTSDVVVTPVIDSSLTTRGYDLGTMERKRFTDAQFVMQNLPGQKGEYNISFAAEDPDSAQPIGTTTDFLGGTILEADTPNEAETAGIRCRLGGIRGYTGTMILTRTVGSPKINSIKVAGSVTNRQIISQR